MGDVNVDYDRVFHPIVIKVNIGPIGHSDTKIVEGEDELCWSSVSASATHSVRYVASMLS